MGQIKNKKLLRVVVLRIKDLREKHKITQENFYNDTNIHIARIERGKQNISISTLDAICKYFNLPLSVFFSEIEKKYLKE
jgi:transcriptional regulator with XRE-family HTH domain